jgi:RNA polymerase sigma-70 factor, ECF subfamily
VISIDENRLVLKAQEGSPNAIDQLLRLYQRQLFRHIQRMLKSDDDAYDALQQTFIGVVKSLRNLRRRELFRPFAFGVASRVCLKALSRRKRQLEDTDQDEEPADTAPSPEILKQLQERRDVLLEQVTALSPKVRSVMLLHFYEGLSLPETAAALEINLGTAKSRLGAGLEKLRSIEEVKQHV